VLSPFDRDRIRKNVAAVYPLYYADVSAHVSRQPRVRLRVDIFCAHALADRETHGRWRRPSVAAADKRSFEQT
jgi:hypothetical protein